LIDWSQFLALVINPHVLRRAIDRDPSQRAAVEAPIGESLFIVAGPGSGKTTVLTLRVLKLIYVDDVDPAAIFATTFTRKAAGELRSRILGWGDDLRRAILRDPSTPNRIAQQVREMDLNRVVTGTLDSIAEQVLTEYRAPGDQPPIPVEEFIASAIMQRHGLWTGGRRDRDPDFQAYIRLLSDSNRPPGQTQMLSFCRSMRDHFIHDQVHIDAFETANSAINPGAVVVCRAIEDYQAQLDDDLIMDFASLEHEFLLRLTSGRLARFLDGLRVALVDEYQDTNYLQEQIYFAIASVVAACDGSITVVGDDDQSLYRFRGATVDLFSAFPQRIETQSSIRPTTIYLSNNYRSTQNIVTMYSNFLAIDPAYGPARVAAKPPLAAERSQSYVDYPVLGMFRVDVSTLARDLAAFIDDVFNGTGYAVTSGGITYHIIKDPTQGAIGDCALLCSSPSERSSGGRARLPRLLRDELATLTSPIEVFNPRGQEFWEIPVVQIILGLMLECIDPNSVVQVGIATLPREVVATFDSWRGAAQAFIATNPPGPPPASGGPPARRNTLAAFVTGWQSRTPATSGRWPREAPLIELLYKLIAWLPEFQDDPEGAVYLEVITRTITHSARFVAYEGVIHRDAPHAERSVRYSLRGIFEPLASGAIEIDEALIEQLPRDRFNILSIHQAKGLEFPLVIVDVSSDFNRNHAAQAFKRYPRAGGLSQNLEDALRPYSPLAALPLRQGRDRAFDDLVRQYFVAYSRPQDVLLLIGLCDAAGQPKDISNIAIGWTRNGAWPWRGLRNLVHI
jgi:DNA helicase-2/ATP-dependent DNA helicase PcrA